MSSLLDNKIEVFKNCCIAGIPLQGILHDISKFSPIEFVESSKYFVGTESPINLAKKENGYSKAWQHHKALNKHHPDYWVRDIFNGGVGIKVPYKYALEMCCDIIVASKTYNGNNYKPYMPYNYFLDKLNEKTLIHKHTQVFILTILFQYAKYGNKALKKKHTKNVYNKIKNNPTNIKKFVLLKEK